ncbi:hypothetical protein BV20DRAFT_431324 [Pilatotrama ljubarskyi]|nr:hypothetical protein BV20DRAFT_431324 [Pilatotrama ljubarskyi]
MRARTHASTPTNATGVTAALFSSARLQIRAQFASAEKTHWYSKEKELMMMVALPTFREWSRSHAPNTLKEHTNVPGRPTHLLTRHIGDATTVVHGPRFSPPRHVRNESACALEAPLRHARGRTESTERKPWHSPIAKSPSAGLAPWRPLSPPGRQPDSKRRMRLPEGASVQAGSAHAEARSPCAAGGEAGSLGRGRPRRSGSCCPKESCTSAHSRTSTRAKHLSPVWPVLRRVLPRTTRTQRGRPQLITSRAADVRVRSERRRAGPQMPERAGTCRVPALRRVRRVLAAKVAI